MSFVILDYTLRTLMGHSFAYDSATVASAREAGWDRIVVLAHQTVIPEIQKALGALPCFSTDLDDDLNGPLGLLLWRTAWIRRNMRLYSRRILRDLAAVPDDLFETNTRNLVFVPTIRHSQLVPIVRWLERVNRKFPVECSIVLRFTAFPDFDTQTCTAEFYRSSLRYLESSRVRDRVRLFTDSEDLAQEYAAYTDMPLRVIPIPHAAPEIPPTASICPTGVPRLVYLGDARRNKGYHLLADLFRSLRAELARGAICAEIQSNIRMGSELEVVRANRVLQRLPNVLLHETTLSVDDYYSLLERADIVLTPYTLDHYHSQTSGIVLEAISAGKPLIVPRGTWAARQIRHFGDCGVTFLPGDVESLRQAVQQAIGDLPSLRERAIAASAACREYHNRSTFFAAISTHAGAG